MTARSLAISCLLGTEALLLAQRPDALRFGGRIVDVLGDPVPAAAIELVIDGRVAQRTFADGEGIYQLAATAGDLLVHARGKARIRLPWRGPTTARVRNVVLQDAARLTGIVRDHRNRPLANAYVVAAYAEGSRRTRSDGRGRYQFDGVPLTRVIVSALGTSTFAQQTVRLTGSSVCDLRLPIEGIPMRTVQVAGLPAAAVRDAFVDVVTPNMALLPDRGRTSLRADGSAEFMLTSFALVQAHAPGHRLTPRGRLVSGTTDAVRFVAHPAPEPGVRLRGKVRVARGPIPAGEQLVVRDVHGTDLAVATIDDRGSFQTATPLTRDQSFRIGVQFARWAITDEERTVRDGYTWLRIDDPEAKIELWLQPTHGLRCSVVADDGTRLEFADIIVADPNEPFRPLVQTYSDRVGACHLPAFGTPYEVLAHDHLGRVCLGHLGGTAARPEIAWQSIPSGSAGGRLVDAEGMPIAGAELFFADVRIQESRNVRASARQQARVRTDRNGRFRCRGLPAGEWTLVALEGAAIAPQRLSVRAGEETTLQLTAQ